MRLSILLFLLALTLPRASADDPVARTLSLADVETRLKEWSSASTDPDLQKVVVPLAEEARNFLEQSAQAEKQTAALVEKTKALPDTVEKLRKSSAAPAALPSDFQPPPEGTSAEQLTVAASRLHTAVEQARNKVMEAKEFPRQAIARRRELSASVNDLTTRILSLRSDSAPAQPSDPVDLTEARALSRSGALAAAQAKLDAAQAELAYMDAAETMNWSSLTLDAATSRLAALEGAEAELNQRIDTARTLSATTLEETAAQNLADAPAYLQPLLAIASARASEGRNVVATLIPAAEAKLQATESRTRKWMEAALEIRGKIRRLGPSGIVGAELRQQRQELPAPAVLQAAASERQETLTAVEVTRLDLEELLTSLPAGADNKTAESKALHSARTSVTTLIQNYATYYSTLVRLEEASQQLDAVTAAHREFIHENILWMPSAIPAGRESVASLSASAKWLGNGFADPSLAVSWWRGVSATPLISGLWAAFVVFLFFVMNIGRRRISSLARLAARPDPGFAPTGAALLWTVVIALPWPALLWALAIPGHASPAATPFLIILSTSLQQLAVIILGLEIIRQPLRPDGLAEAHFQWPSNSVKSLRWQFRRLSALLLPCVLTGLLFRHSEEVRHDPAERGCLVLLLVATAWWLHRFWRTAGRHSALPDRGVARLAGIGIRAISILTPLVLAGLAIRGYLYTAEVLTERLALTLLSGSVFLLARALFFRWHRLHRRQLRAARARQLREARDASRAAAAASAQASEHIPPAATGSELAPENSAAITGPDIDEIGEELRGLVDIIVFIAAAAMTWAIWSDVLPSAKNLTPHPLDAVSIVRPDSAAAAPAAELSALVPAAPAEQVSTVPRTTWLAALVAAGAAILTVMAAKRIPGALQFVLTSQLTLDAGARFALSTVTRYVIIIGGVIITLGLLGITWGSVQWLAAALTVGLGFGLQEIFANFFSGLIILLERPIRPGDVVTIDDITGTISRIQIRATTIRAADGKDYIVPNKEFVTGKLLNWTRTDTATRQEISVGVSYDADPAAALALLAKVAADHQSVLKEPAPIVTFDAFGDSALQLRLLFYVGCVEHRLPTRTDLHCAIAREFRAAGIAIPYPQRDVHLHPAPLPAPVEKSP